MHVCISCGILLVVKIQVTQLIKENVDGLMDDGNLFNGQNPGNTINKGKCGWIDG
mgnify:CR=1 FL=1